jgi:non-ribosomal peptide synthetase component F/aryl carrier-like protein
VEFRTIAATLLPIDVAVEEAMAEKMPSYMIVFFAVNSIPLNTSGKTDRRKLRDLGSSFSLEKLAEMRDKGGSKSKPKTVSECTLHEIWAAVLGMSPDAIGLDDNFFKIGGDSLSAMSLVGMARSKTGTSSLSMAQIFQNPKLVDQACLLGIEAQEPEPADVEPFALIQGDVDVQACQEEVAEACGVLPEKVLDVYPCTPLQEGFVSLSLKKQGHYVLRRVMEVGTSVDLNRLARAWERLVRSYPILRIRVVQHSKLGLVQVVLDEPLHWTSADNLEGYLEQDKANVVALGQPLARYCLVTDSRTRQRRFVWTIHHALYDGWTMPMMIEQVESFYHNITATASCAPNFSNFVGRLLKTPKFASDEFWRSRLQGYDGEGAFPVLPPSVTEPNVDSRTEMSFTLPQQSHSSGLTLASIVRTAWAIVAHRQTGKRDICFGNVVSGRSASGVRNIETLLGPTVATVPFRVQISPEQTPLSLAQVVQDISVEAMPFEQTGLQNIAKVIVDAQSICEGFQTLLAIRPPDSNDSMSSLGCWQDVSHIKDFATYALTVICHVSVDGGASKIEVVYDSRILDAWSVQNIAEQLIHQIEQLVMADEHALFSIGDMPSLPPDHAAKIWGWNRTVPEPLDQLIHELIAQRTRERPDSPAVCSWDGTLNYTDLDRLSTIVASQLVALNVGPGNLVPLFFEKSMYAIVAIVGVLKTGAAYVPIDPNQAQDRKQLILEKAKAKVVLTSETYSKVVLDRETSSVETMLAVGPSTLKNDDLCADLVLQGQLEPSKAAYVIFTSGSTGTPKGVVLTHRSVASSCTYHGAMIGLHHGSRVLQFSSYAFDASVFEILTTLIHGGCVCTPSTEERYEDISKTIVSMSVNTAFFTPSVARLLDPERLPSLDTILLGGEASSESDLW